MLGRAVLAMMLGLMPALALAQSQGSPTFTNLRLNGTLTTPGAQITGTAAMGGPDGQAPTLAGTGYQIYARRYATGTASNGVNLSLLNVEGDTATVTGQNFLNVFAVQNSFGGSTVQGGRQGIQASVNQTAATNSSNGNRNYVGIYGAATSSSGDGGTDLTTGAKGAYFGMNPLCILNAGATNTLNCSAAEVNIAVKSGASTNYKSGIQIAQLPFDAVQGSSTDAAISISNQTGAVGWKNGILFGPQNVQAPLSGSGYILQSYGPGMGTVAITALGVIQTSNLAGTGTRALYADTAGTLTPTAPSGAPLQRVSTQTATLGSISSTTTLSDTPPTTSNTTLIPGLALSVTPKAAGNKLRVRVVLQGSTSTLAVITAALFQGSSAPAQNSGVSAVASNYVTCAGAGYVAQVVLTYDLTAGSTAPIYFGLGASQNSNGTLTINGTGGTRNFGGTTFSHIEVEEFAA